VKNETDLASHRIFMVWVHRPRPKGVHTMEISFGVDSSSSATGPRTKERLDGVPYSSLTKLQQSVGRVIKMCKMQLSYLKNCQIPSLRQQP